MRSSRNTSRLLMSVLAAFVVAVAWPRATAQNTGSAAVQRLKTKVAQSR